MPFYRDERDGRAQNIFQRPSDGSVRKTKVEKRLERYDVDDDDDDDTDTVWPDRVHADVRHAAIYDFEPLKAYGGFVDDFSVGTRGKRRARRFTEDAGERATTVHLRPAARQKS